MISVVVDVRQRLREQRIVRERVAQLCERPAFDDRETVLDHLARRHLQQQAARRRARVECVFAGVQLARYAQFAREDPPIEDACRRGLSLERGGNRRNRGAAWHVDGCRSAGYRPIAEATVIEVRRRGSNAQRENEDDENDARPRAPSLTERC